MTIMMLLIANNRFKVSLTLVLFGLFVLAINTDMIVVKAQQQQQPQEQQPQIFKIQPVTRLGDKNKNKNINKKKQQSQTLQQFFDSLQLIDSSDMSNHQQLFGNKDTTKNNNVFVNDKICIQCEKGRDTHRSLKHNSTANKKKPPPTTAKTTASSPTALVNKTTTTDSTAVVRLDPLQCIRDSLENIQNLFVAAGLILGFTGTLFFSTILCLLQGGTTCNTEELLLVATFSAVGFVFFPFIIIETLLFCSKSSAVFTLLLIVFFAIYSLLTAGNLPTNIGFDTSDIKGTVDITDLTAILTQLQQSGGNGRQRQRQRRHRLLPELDNAEETLLPFNHIDTIFEKVTTSTMEFLVNDISQHSDDDGNDTADNQYHNIGKRFLQQQQESLFSTSTQMNMTASLRNIPQMLLQNEFIQDLLESVVLSLTNQSTTTTTTTTTSASKAAAIPFNTTDISSMIIKTMNDLPHDPNGIDALLDFNFDDKTMIQLRTFSSSFLSDPTILDSYHRRMSNEEADEEEAQEECSLEQRMLCMTRSLFDTVNLIPV